jgi:hypothetical protein
VQHTADLFSTEKVYQEITQLFLCTPHSSQELDTKTTCQLREPAVFLHLSSPKVLKNYITRDRREATYFLQVVDERLP